MSRSRSSVRFVPPLLRPLLVLALLPMFAACSGIAAGHTSSPWEWGGGVRLAPAFAVGDGDVTVHPMAGYTYLSFDGGNDQLFEFGAQVRKPLGSEARPLWIGGEGTYSRLETSIDGGGADFGTNGWSATAMLGKPIGDGDWQPNVWAGAGISDYGAQGWNIRLGIEVQPPFVGGN